MLEFNLADPGEGSWFPYRKSKVDPNNETNIIWDDPVDEARFQLRSIKLFIENKLKNDKTEVKNEFVYNPSSKKMERISYTPEKTMSEMIKETEQMYVWSILDWEGVGTKGQLIEVNDENKIKLSKNEEFVRFFNRCQKELENASTEYKEESEKN